MSDQAVREVRQIKPAQEQIRFRLLKKILLFRQDCNLSESTVLIYPKQHSSLLSKVKRFPKLGCKKYGLVQNIFPFKFRMMGYKK
jgi:hypothetical protein